MAHLDAGRRYERVGRPAAAVSAGTHPAGTDTGDDHGPQRQLAQRAALFHFRRKHRIVLKKSRFAVHPSAAVKISSSFVLASLTVFLCFLHCKRGIAVYPLSVETHWGSAKETQNSFLLSGSARACFFSGLHASEKITLLILSSLEKRF